MTNNDTPSGTSVGIVLTDVQAAHCRRVSRLVQEEIDAAGGFMSFERYMELALYAPGLGYYAAGAHKFGGEGDFATAPEISGLFGGCVARQCAEAISALPAASILEVGAGTGRLAADVLLRLEALRVLPERYFILESSADLRERQRLMLQRWAPGLLERVHWLDAPLEQPFDGVIIANEVLDALPVARFRWHGTDVEELGVTLAAQGFAWAVRPAADAMNSHCQKLAHYAHAWERGYVSEYCPRLAAFTQTVTAALRRGAVLWFDYGLPRAQYYLPERRDGTLLCHFRHRTVTDPFLHPGLQDITAWVDFTALAEASRSARFELAGFATQTFFLIGAGMEAELRELGTDDAVARVRLANQAKQLMLPGEMGERFKAMAWLRGIDIKLSGFTLQDLRHTL